MLQMSDEIKDKIRGLPWGYRLAAEFLFAAATNVTKELRSHWTVMLSRHIGLPIYTDSFLLTCQNSK